MRTPRFWFVVVVMLVAAIVLHARGDVDRVPPSQPLTEMPHTIGSLSGTDIPLDTEVLEVLGKGFFLNRTYAPAGLPNDPESLGLFIGYFPTQRTGQSIHSPQNCLPGAGWVFDSSGVTDLHNPDGTTAQVGEYIISNGPTRAEVLYWYRSHGRSIANDYKAKLYTLADSIRYSRTDAALVRIVTAVRPGETPADAHQRAVAFAEQVNPLLPAFIPN